MNLSHYPQTPLATYENTLMHLLRPFPLVRFMNWQQINRKSGDKRPLVCHHDDLPHDNWEYTGGPWSDFCGVPIERMVRLANAVGSRPWICIPIAASDELMAHIVEHVVSDADQMPIFEFANEVWNNHFWQHSYAAEQGQVLGLGSDTLSSALAWQAERTKVLAEMVGDSAEVTVGAQFFNLGVARQLLQHLGDSITALSVAPYLGRMQSSLEGGNPRPLADIHAEVKAEIDGDVTEHLQQYHALTDRYGVQLYAYEGGLHQVARNWDNAKQTTLSKGDFAQAKQAFLDYNRSPYAADNTSHLWQAWRDNGGALFNPYSLATTYENVWNGDTQNQFFGHCEIVGKQIRILPKYRAARDAARQMVPSAQVRRLSGGSSKNLR